MLQLGGFLSKLFGSLIRTGLSLIANVLKSLTKCVLAPLELTAAASATDTIIQKKMFGFITTTLIFTNEKLNDIMKIIKSLEQSERFENEVTEQKGAVFRYIGRYIRRQFIQEIYQQEKAYLELAKKRLELVKTFSAIHPLTIFEIQKHYQNEPKFNAVSSRNNLLEIKDEPYVINLDKFKSIEIYWIALYVNGGNVTYLIILELKTFQNKLKNS